MEDRGKIRKINTLGHVRPKRYKKSYDTASVEQKETIPELEEPINNPQANDNISEEGHLQLISVSQVDHCEGAHYVASDDVNADKQQFATCNFDVSQNVSVNVDSEHPDLHASHHGYLSDNDDIVDDDDELQLMKFLLNPPSSEEIQLQNKEEFSALFENEELHKESWNRNDDTDESDMEDEPCDTNSEQECLTDNLQDKLYPGHSLSLSSAMLMIWLYVITFSISGQQFSMLLKLLNIFMLTKHTALNSVHMFKKFFAQIASTNQKHYYCSFCLTQCSEDTDICGNKSCNKNLNKKTKNYFLEVSVEAQIKTLFQRKEFISLLKKRKNLPKRKDKNIEDLSDGQAYRNSYDDSNLLHNLTFTLNTDGIPIFKSSKVSAWPVFLMINELPYKYRKKTDYMIMSGLWCGDGKPLMNSLMEPLYKSLTKLKHGIDIHLPDGALGICHANLVCFSADLPAKSSVLNMNQFNGEFSCIKCYQPGINYRSEGGGNIRIFPYNEEDPCGPARNSNDSKQQAYTAVTSSSAVKGIKGPSYLMMIDSFDYVKSTSIDYMHCVLLGITRLLTKLWFQSKFSKEKFSISNFTSIVDTRLSNIKPTHTVTRLPRTITEHFKFWKASELRAWLFYYSLPILHNILDFDYFYHYAAFVNGIYLLCQNSISDTDLEISERLLKYFVYMMNPLYGERYLTLNVHLLLHLPDNVKNLGPLWSHSCFPFENANGDLQKYFHGTQYIDMQIASAVNIIQQLPVLAESVEEQDPEAKEFLNKLLKQDKKTDKTENLSRFVGKSYHKDLDFSVTDKILAFLNKPIDSLLFYRRAIIRSAMYHSVEYTRVSVRCSYTISYLCQGRICYGFIQFFIEHLDKITNSVTSMCAIQKLEPLHTTILEKCMEKSVASGKLVHCKENFLKIDINFVQCLKQSNDVDIIPIENILDLWICVQKDGDTVILCKEPNNKEFNL